MAGFFTAPSIAWGPGAIEQLSGLGAHRAVVALDPNVAAQEAPRRVVEELERAGTAVTVVADRAVGPAIGQVTELAARLREVGPDWIVAVGGGATIDGAKGARLLFERPELSGERFPVDLSLPERPRSHLVAIPTTSGSGAEASWTADLVAADGSPVELAHRSLVPDWALVDAAFAQGLTTETVVAGALETAALATEAFLSAWSNPFSDALAVDAVRTVVHRLPHAVRWSDDPDARGALHYAATVAGLAQSNAQRGLAHALARALVRPTGLGYATILGAILGRVLEFDRSAARERLEALAEMLRRPDEPTRASVVDRLDRLRTAVAAPAGLAAAGARPEHLAAERERIVAETLRSPAVLANPRVPTASDVRQLLDALAGPVGPSTP